MSSPAELLAQKHRESASVSATPEPTSNFSDDTDDEIVSDTEETIDSLESTPVPVKKLNIYDTTAFPSLGKSSGSSNNGSSSWGKSTNSWSAAASNSSTQSTNSTFKPAVKSSTTQLTFIIDDDQQKNLTSSERFKIMSNIMTSENVKIESTLSTTTKKRTFLLSGKSENVQNARKQILRQITKPTELEFTIPSKLRSTVIGSRGKNLNPIIQSTGVKIDIERSSDSTEEFVPSNEDEELFGMSLKVTISGDFEGCQDAKNKILAIVDENTKSLNVKIPIDAKIKKFVPGAISKLQFAKDVDVVVPDANSRASNIIISGPKDVVITTRNQIKKLLESIESNITVTEKSIPKQLHDLLNIAEIFEEANVIVEIPDEDSPSNSVKFVGLASNIPKAIDIGRKMTSEVVTDSLNLSKSHGSNVEHAKNLASFFTYTKFLDAVSNETNVKVKGPSYKSLASPETDSVSLSFSTLKDNKDAIKDARKSIVEIVNKIPPSYVRSIEDIESFLFSKLDNSVAIQENVSMVPLGSLSGVGNKLILVVQQSDDEFLPSAEEIKERLDRVEASLSKLKDLSSTLVAEIIPLSAADQVHLEGNSLNVLLNKFEPNTIEIKLHQNAEGQSDNEIYLRGYKSAIKQAIDQINQLVEDVKNYEEASKYNSTTEIPVKFLARFIGQKGAHLNELSDDFNVKIDVLTDSEDNVEKAAIKLTGLKSNVDELIKKIDSLAKRWADEVSLVIKVEPKYHKKLVGPGGIYINRLQDKYHVKILLPHSTAEEPKSDVLIRGPSRGVAKAEEEIKMLLDYEKDNGFKDEIKVSKEALGNIIGRKGETLNDITADTGVEVQVGDSNGDSKEVVMTITGSKKGISEAINKIRAIEKRAVNFVTETIEVDSKWYRNLIGPSGLTKREIMLTAGGDEKDRDFRRLLQFPSISDDSNTVKCEGDKEVVAKIIARIQELVAEYESVTEEKVEVAKNLHKYVIGPSGIVKNGIESDFKVKIFIPSKTSEKTDISVKGTPENIAVAIKKIQELVEGKK